MTFDIQGVLFPNWITMLVQLCSTLVLFLLCKKLLWKPARDILAKRRDKMNENLMSSQKLREDASVELDKAKEELEHARNRSGEIVESARKEAENLRAEIVNKANSEASAKLALADKEIEQKRGMLKIESTMKWSMLRWLLLVNLCKIKLLLLMIRRLLKTLLERRNECFS